MRLLREKQYATHSRAVSSKMTHFTCLQKSDISNAVDVIRTTLTACFGPEILRNFGLELLAPGGRRSRESVDRTVG